MNEKEVMNTYETAEFLGISRATLFKLLKEKKIPARRLGRNWKFSRTQLIKYLAGEEVKGEAD